MGAGCRNKDARALSRAPLSAMRRAVAGSAAVEFVVAAPILLALLVPVVDLGMAYSQRLRLEQAVQAGAQYAIFHPWSSNSPTAIAAAVRAASALSGVSISPAPYQACGCPNGSAINLTACNITCPGGETAGYYAVVSARLTYAPMLPYSLLGDTVTLSAQSTVRIR